MIFFFIMILEAFVLGCGGMMPLPWRHLTSVLLRREGDQFLFDCGEGTQMSLKRLNLRWKKISAIFISHTHADHVTGLPGMLMLSSQVDRDDPLYIIGPPKIKEYIDASIKTLDMYINYEIIVKEICNPSEPQVVYEGEGYEIRSFPLRHSKVCVGYSLVEKPRPGLFFPEKAKAAEVPMGPMWSQLQNGESVTLEDGRVVASEDVLGPARKGRKFSFVTDTGYFPEIANHVDGSDLLICEGMFTKDLAVTAAEKKHLTSTQAGLIARHGNVKKMGLIHYSPRLIDRDLKVLLQETREEFEDVFLTRDRMEIDIPYEE